MKINDTVIHVFGSEEVKGKVIGIGFGIFAGMLNVKWSDGKAYHHKPKYLRESA